MSDLNAPRSVDLLEVCNRSIDLAGGQRINSLEDKVEEARLSKLHFKFIRDKLLWDHDWSWASYYKEIAKSSNDPVVDEWDYKYPINFDNYIRLREFVDSNPNYEIGYSEQEEGRVIYTNESSPIKIRYTGIPSAATWSPGFVDALVYLLAAEMSRTLIETTTASGELFAMGEARKMEAMEVDANENNFSEDIVDLLVNLR